MWQDAKIVTQAGETSAQHAPVPQAVESSPAPPTSQSTLFEHASNVDVNSSFLSQVTGNQVNVNVHPLVETASRNNARRSYFNHGVSVGNRLSAAGDMHNPITYDYNSPNLNRHIYMVEDRQYQDSSRTTTSMLYAPESSNKIYAKYLELKQRGTPLWIPGSNRVRPLLYRHKGVCIGDVGVITRAGAFSFMFNIFLPAGHPINPHELPDGFEPLEPPSISEIDQYTSFLPGNHLASSTITRVLNTDPSFRGMSFKTMSTEGAILIFPDGAIGTDFTNINRMSVYAKAHLASWYRYAKGVRGRDVKNGELHLVTGCDKATSWGMAAVANVEANRHTLKYYPSNVRDSDAHDAIPMYQWEYSGLAETRAGPDLEEIGALRQTDPESVFDEALIFSVITVGGNLCNQCLFVRTINQIVNKDVFETIEREIEAEMETQVLELRAEAKSRAMRSRAPLSDLSTSMQKGSAGQQSSSGMAPANTLAPNVESLSSELEHLDLGRPAPEDHAMPKSETASRSHPSDHLNKHLLELYPHCDAVITHDMDWCVVINEKDEVMPRPEEITKRVLAIHDVVEEDGLVYLELKKAVKDLNHRKTSEIDDL